MSKLSLCGISWWPLGSLTQVISTICPSLCLGLQSEGPVRESRAAEEGLDQQLVLAVVGSVSATCLTILAALLALVCIRRSCLHRRRTFTYQSGSVSVPYPRGKWFCLLCVIVSTYMQVYTYMQTPVHDTSFFFVCLFVWFFETGFLCVALVVLELTDYIHKDSRAGQWWCTPLIPAFGRQRQTDLCVRGQPGLQSEFQDSQDYTGKLCIEKIKKPDQKKKKRFQGLSGKLSS
jgi:hypothetical protein